MSATIEITGAGLTGTLKLTWVHDDLAHVFGLAGPDEPTGTWTGLACPDHGLPIDSHVNLNVLKRLCADSEIADLIWEAPDDLMAEHNRAHLAMRAYQAGNTQLAPEEWSMVQAVWTRVWEANCAAIKFMQEAGITRFSPRKPQRWVVASFEHYCSPHGVQRPHVHNIVVTALTM